MDENSVLRTEFAIAGMTCAHCERAVGEAFRGLAGVTAVEADAATGTAVVSHDRDLAAAEIAAALDDAGYALRS